MERIDPLDSATQLLIVTPDAESTIALVAGAYAHFGAQGIDVIPATGAARTARLLKTDPARAIAGPPTVLRQLVESSALQLGSLRGIVFAWVDDIIEDGGEPLADMETVLAEAAKGATRVLLVRDLTGRAGQFAERHMHGARRVGVVGSAVRSRLQVSYVTTSAAARPAALRRVLDDVDPPSAAVLVRGDDSETEARSALRQLGYRRADDVVRVVRDQIPPNVHTVILYDPVLQGGALEAIGAAHPARVVALVEPREVSTLRQLTGGSAVPLERAAGHPRARRSDELLRRDVREVLTAGFGLREISTIEPLLAEYDAAEVAGALVRILEKERERSARPVPSAPSPRRSDGDGGRPAADSARRSPSADTGRGDARGGPRGAPRGGPAKQRPRQYDDRRGPRR